MQIYSDKKQAFRRARNRRIKFYFLIFLFSLFAVSICYFAIYSSLFKIKFITVENNNFFSKEEVLGILKPIVLGGKIGGLAGFNNLLSWPSGKITVPDLAVSDINIKKNWFQRTIEVEVNERQKFAIWCVDVGQNCYWMDKQGVIFGKAPSTEGSLVSVISDSRMGGLALGSKVEEERFVGNLISILENLNMLDLEINKRDFDNELQELTVSTVGGPIIIFGLRFDSAKNIPLIKNIKNLDYKKLKYIKLNVSDNKIIYTE